MFRERMSRRRSTMSAIVPAGMPTKKSGAILSASATPTMKGLSVRSSISQLRATCSPMKSDGVEEGRGHQHTQVAVAQGWRGTKPVPQKSRGVASQNGEASVIAQWRYYALNLE